MPARRTIPFRGATVFGGQRSPVLLVPGYNAGGPVRRGDDDLRFRLLTEDEARDILIHVAPIAEMHDLRIRAQRVLQMEAHRAGVRRSQWDPFVNGVRLESEVQDV